MKNIVLLALFSVTLVELRAQVASSTFPLDTLKTYTLPEIVVTATRSEKNPNDVGRSVTVLTAEQVKRSLMHSVGELLAWQAGMYTVGAGQNFGANQTVFLRGAAGHQTAVMVDDVRLTDPSGVNNALDLSELSFVGIDRLEIVRGAHSTLYGSSAIGGVVNLITQKNRTPGFHTDVRAWTGTFGKGTSQFGQELFLNFTDLSGLYLNGSVLNNRVKGLDATVDTTTDPKTFNRRDRDGLTSLDLMGKAGFRNDEFDAYVSLKRHTETKEIDRAAYRDDDNYRLDFRRTLLTYGVSYQPNARWNLKFLGGSSDMRRYAVDDSSVVDNAGNTDQTYADAEYTGTTTTNEFQTTLRLPGFEAVSGAGIYKETMGSKSFYYSNSIFGPFEFATNLDTLGLHSTTKNLFLHLDFNGYLLHASADRWNLAIGARLNYHSAFGNYSTFEVNPSVRFANGGIIYASYSTGFAAPSLYQLFAPDRDFTSGITRGNSGLKPERSRALEVGLKHSLNADTRFSVSFFHTVTDQTIEYVYLWEKDVRIEELGNDFRRNDFRGDTYLNLGTQTASGFELTVHAKVHDRLTLDGNVSLVKGTLRYSPSGLDPTQTHGHHVQLYNTGAFLSTEAESAELVRRPGTLNVGLTYAPLGDWLLRLAVKHAGSRSDVYYDSQRGPFGALGTVPVAQYTIVDLSQQYFFSDRLSVSARVENVFNRKYLEINGFTTRGRGIFLSVRYAWNK